MRDRNSVSGKDDLQQYKSSAANKYQKFIQENKEEEKEINQDTKALNITQKHLIEGALNFLFSMSSSSDPGIAVKALEVAINSELANYDYWMKFLFDYQALSNPEKKIFSMVETIQNILSHPCAQNMNESDYSIDQPDDPNTVVYLNSKGQKIHEPKGWLNLTIENDDTAPPVTQEAVVAYIKQLVSNKIKSKNVQVYAAAKAMFSSCLDSENGILDLSECKLVKNDGFYLCVFLANHPEIQSLLLHVHLMDCEFIALIGDSIINMPNLISLSIKGSWQNNVAAIGSCVEKVSSFDLSGNMNDKGISAIADFISKNTNLISLTIDSGCNAPEQEEMSPKVSMHITREGYRIGDNGAIAIAQALINKPNLSSLKIRGGCIGDEGAIAISKAIANLNLISLSIHGDRIAEKGVLAIADAIYSQPNLISVDIHGHYIRDEGAIEIAKAVANKSNCTSLKLYGYYISNAGAIEITKIIASNPNITALDISGGYIGNFGVKALISNLNLKSLKVHGGFLKEDDQKILTETNPIKKANYGRVVGINAEVPSLYKLCLFAASQLENKNSQLVPIDIAREIRTKGVK